jgi:hypothetical protein
MTAKRTISATIRTLPPGAPSRVWLVLRPTGEHYFMYKEPLEGWAIWAKGFAGTVVEYPFGAVTYTAPVKKTVPPRGT